MARINGCPTNIRDWSIFIETLGGEWIPIKGLTSMTVSQDADTEDGSSADSLYEEPYVTKRSGSISLEGKPIYYVTDGSYDPGQELLNYYATVGGCDGDARLKVIDTVGHAEIWTIVVTGTEKSPDESGESVSWDLEMVGQPVVLDFVPVTSITTSPATNLSVKTGIRSEVTVTFNPATASNQKYAVASNDTSRVRVASIDGNKFELIGVYATSTPVKVLVKTKNGNKTAELSVTVTES